MSNSDRKLTGAEVPAHLRRAHFALRTSGVAPTPSTRLSSGIHSRGYLPHVKRENATYFVTFRLHDSLPKQVLLEYSSERERLIKEAARDPTKLKEADLNYRRKIERYLDLGRGQCELQIPKIAETVAAALMFFHEKDYILDEWVIMPNHVHLIILPLPGRTLSKILAGRKTYTSRRANSLLNRNKSRFWKPESYDHWIRSDEEKDRIRRYIRNNPVKAGLCKTPEAWPWSSAGWKKSA